MKTADSDLMAGERLSSLFMEFHKWATQKATSLPPGAPVATQILDGMNAVEDEVSRYSSATGRQAVILIANAMRRHFTLDATPIRRLWRKYGDDFFEIWGGRWASVKTASPVVVIEDAGKYGESASGILSEMDTMTENLTANNRYARIVKRIAYPMALDEVLNTLAELSELSNNIEESIDTFAMHYRMAAVDPMVTTQKDLLVKAREGLRAANMVISAVKAVLQQYPDDKTALRAMKDAETMVDRFTKHEQDASKIIRIISKKAMPPELKKYAAKLNKALSDRMVNSDMLQVIPWQQDAYRDVIFKVVFKVVDGTFNVVANAYEDLSSKDGPLASMGEQSYNGKRLSSSEFVEQFFAGLKGWPGIKGEADAIGVRSVAAQKVMNALNSAIGRMNGWMSEKATISQSGTEVEASYRSNLPKEGASDVGESRYEEMVRDEIARFKKVVEPLLSPYMDLIAGVHYYDSEKSWINVEVELK